MASIPLKKIALLWFFWFVCIYFFQFIVSSRYSPAYPDNVIWWTEFGTTSEIVHGRKYISESFMKNQSAMDSEFYVSMALFGYNDPDARAEISPKNKEAVLDVKAFFPFYPLLMSVISMPFRLSGMDPIAAVKLAGVIVSLIGIFAAMIALYHIVRKTSGDNDAFRAIYFMLIFPTGFYFAQIYTEGLFAGLAFSIIALAMNRRFLLASILAVFAVWTKGVGILLVIPIAWEWYQSPGVKWDHLNLKEIPLSKWAKGLFILLPVLSFCAFSISPIGKDFYHIQNVFFGRTNFDMVSVVGTFKYLGYLIHELKTKSLVYYGLEYSMVLLALISCILLFKRYTSLALFGLAIIVVSFLSGPFQSQSRYILMVPTLYILLAESGRNELFERGWSIASILLLGMLTSLYTFKMWVA